VGYGRIAFHLPAIAPQDVEYAGRFERMAAPVYDLLRRVSPIRWPITVVFPALLAVMVRRPTSGSGA
jgi:hypothetical protein